MLPALLVVAMFAVAWMICAVKAWKKRHEKWGESGATDAMADGWHDFTGMYHMPAMSPVTKGAPPARSEPLDAASPNTDAGATANLKDIAAELGTETERIRFYCTRSPKAPNERE